MMPGGIWISEALCCPHRFLFFPLLLVYLRCSFRFALFSLIRLFYYKNKNAWFLDSLISALVDSGASSNFIDSAFLSTLALTPSQLPIPIKLSLFDGEPTSHGLITHSISTNLLFPPSSFQVVDLLVMTLHPSASIVLGLPWLRYTNPDIDWDSTSDPVSSWGSPSSGASFPCSSFHFP